MDWAISESGNGTIGRDVNPSPLWGGTVERSETGVGV